MGEFLEDLRNSFDIAEVPFSYPGSRILIHQYPGKSCLYVKLAERLISIFPGLESYLVRPPFISDFGLLDTDGQLLPFQVSTWPHLIEMNTSVGKFTISFENEDTFYINLPPDKTCGIQFNIPAKQWEKLQNGGMVSSYRNLHYATNAEILENNISVKDEFGVVKFLVDARRDSAIRFNIDESHPIDRPLENAAIIIQSAETEWNRWFDRIPKVKDIYREKYAYAWWALVNNLISARGNISFEMAVPSKKGYIGAWLWDSALHAIAFRHIDPGLARNQIRGMLAHQMTDGMLPDAIFDDGIVTEIDHPFQGRVTKPPILAWAAMKIHEKAPDVDFIKEIYPPLVKWNRWWFEQNDDDHDGLVQYNHPYSSGMDDHPAWDFGFPVDSPDINTYLCLQMQSLAQMACLLKMDAEADEWKRRSDNLLNLMIIKLWDEKSASFKIFKDKTPLPTNSIVGLLPLWIGGLPAGMNKKIIEHLLNSGEFGGKFVLPVVARNDRNFNPDKMWRGPVWANINYFMIEALKRIAEPELAVQLRDKTLELIMSNAGIYEYYNAVTGKPGQAAMPVFSWTAAVFIDLAIQASEESKKGAANAYEKR